MTRLLDRLFLAFMWLGLGFLMVLAGAWMVYDKWGIVRAYDVVSVFFSDLAKEKDGLSNAQIRPAQTHILHAESMAPGDTLITRADDTLTLLDAQGAILHTWHKRFYDVWPTEGVQAPPSKSFYHFREAHLYPNGDVVALYHDLDSGNGVGLVRLDKESNLLWGLRGPVHNGLAARGDKLYVLRETPVTQEQAETLQYGKPPETTDELLVLSARDGKVKDVISLLEAFAGTPFEQLLYSHGNGKRKYINAVSIQLLPEELAAEFPQFAPDCLLISFRNLHSIAVLDLLSGKIVWAMRSLWARQDTAVFGDEGTIWVFDNRGYFDGGKKDRPRLVQVNVADHTLRGTWLPQVGVAVGAQNSGDLRRLPGGNLLVSLTQFGKVQEITPKGEVVWEHVRDEPVHSAVRVPPGYLPEGF